MPDDTLFEEARRSISELFSDTTVPVDVTIDRLEALEEDIKSMLNSLEVE